MVQRIITAAILLCIFIPALLLSHTFVFPLLAAVLSAVAAMEMQKCVNIHKLYAISVPTVLFAFLIPLLSRTGDVNIYRNYLYFVFCFLFYLLVVGIFCNDKIKFEQIALAFFTAIFLSLSFSSIVLLRDIPKIGHYAYILIFIGAWVSDTFAYFTGMLLGKHKLIPKISPKKTVEGSVGAVVFCAAAFALYGFILAKYFALESNILVLALVGAVISCVSQLGDLCMSAIKRNYAVKDFGRIFPGHGGVLDRFNSILAVAPVLFLAFGNPDFLNAIH